MYRIRHSIPVRSRLSVPGGSRIRWTLFVPVQAWSLGCFVCVSLGCNITSRSIVCPCQEEIRHQVFGSASIGMVDESRLSCGFSCTRTVSVRLNITRGRTRGCLDRQRWAAWPTSPFSPCDHSIRTCGVGCAVNTLPQNARYPT